MGDRCVTCSGLASARWQRCYQCERHRELAAGRLADVVACAGYAVRGEALAEDLWRYKSAPDSVAAPARDRLRLTLLRFLRDRGPQIWDAAGMERGPALWAVVPTGRGRFGEHPLAELVAPCLRLPRVSFAARPGAEDRGRELDPGWLRVAAPVHGQDVLVLDDTWVTGSSAQSAAAALKLAGAGRVAIVVLGRHVSPHTGNNPS
jgi:hypothetical protein